MPQGLKALTSGNQQKLRHKKAHAKASSKAKAAKKGSKLPFLASLHSQFQWLEHIVGAARSRGTP
jgi:hypothetical protein